MPKGEEKTRKPRTTSLLSLYPEFTKKEEQDADNRKQHAEAALRNISADYGGKTRRRSSARKHNKSKKHHKKSKKHHKKHHNKKSKKHRKK